jgi:hypothetical protein
MQKMSQINISIYQKVIKYIIIGLVITISTKYIPDIPLKNEESIMIGFITSITFAILDMISPTIIVKKDKN